MLDHLERRARKRTWREHAMTIEIYHLKALSKDPYHSVRKTAEELGRSYGAISEDLRLSLALRIYPEVAEFNKRIDAINYLKDRGKCLIYPCKDWTLKQREEIMESLMELVK